MTPWPKSRDAVGAPRSTASRRWSSAAGSGPNAIEQRPAVAVNYYSPCWSRTAPVETTDALPRARARKKVGRQNLVQRVARWGATACARGCNALRRTSLINHLKDCSYAGAAREKAAAPTRARLPEHIPTEPSRGGEGARQDERQAEQPGTGARARHPKWRARPSQVRCDWQAEARQRPLLAVQAQYRSRWGLDAYEQARRTLRRLPESDQLAAYRAALDRGCPPIGAVRHVA